jgi:hypothetical protein
MNSREWTGARAFRQEEADFQSAQLRECLVGEPFDSQMGHIQTLPGVGGIIEGEREIFSCSTKRDYSCDTSPSGKRGSTSSCLSPDTVSSPTYIL